MKKMHEKILYILGSILFILYIKYLQSIAAKYGLSVQLYADDSQVYISFYPSSEVDLVNVTEKANNLICVWQK